MTPPMLNRRQVMLAAAAAMGVTPDASASAGPALKDRAARRGILFGSEFTARALRSSAKTTAAIIAECAVIVPGSEMKWGYTERRRGSQDYTDADLLVDFAQKNHLLVRGHAAVWYKNVPAWGAQALSPPGGKDVLIARVRQVVGHFRGKICEWDVVNEAFQDSLGGELREWPAFAGRDPGYIADCFHAAHEADPDALLFYNDYGLEYQSAGEVKRREVTLDLLSSMTARNEPIHGLGIQSHLKVGNRFNGQAFRRFLADVASLGLRISLTEFDVDDRVLPAGLKERDQGVADHAKAFLETALDETAVKAVLTWGISDTDTWLNYDRPRADGRKQRSLPLDADFARKPLWSSIAEALDGAPLRA